MTALTERRTRSAAGAPPRPGLPQVNLLPPEVRAARALGTVKKWLAVAVAGALAVSVLGVGFAALAVRGAETSLTEAQDDTQALLADQAKYAEVPTVLGALDDAKVARRYGMAGDILWYDYLGAITAVLPATVSVDSITMQEGAPQDPVSESSNPLVDSGIARLTIVARTATVPDTAAWLTALGSVPGFGEPFMTSSPISELDGSVYYKVTADVEVDPTALSLRYLIPEEGS